MGLARQGAMRCRRMPFAFQSFRHSAGPTAGNRTMPPSRLRGAGRRLARFGRRLARPRGRKLDTSPARLVQADGDRLLGIAGAVFSFPDMVHLFTDKFARLSGSRFAFSAVFLGSFQGLCFRHKCSFLVSPLTRNAERPGSNRSLPDFPSSNQPRNARL